MEVILVAVKTTNIHLSSATLDASILQSPVNIMFTSTLHYCIHLVQFCA